MHICAGMEQGREAARCCFGWQPAARQLRLQACLAQRPVCLQLPAHHLYASSPMHVRQQLAGRPDGWLLTAGC